MNPPSSFAPWIEAVREGRLPGFFVCRENEGLLPSPDELFGHGLLRYSTPHGALYGKERLGRHFRFESETEFLAVCRAGRVEAGSAEEAVALGSDRYLNAVSSSLLLVGSGFHVSPTFLAASPDEAKRMRAVLEDLRAGGLVLQRSPGLLGKWDRFFSRTLFSSGLRLWTHPHLALRRRFRCLALGVVLTTATEVASLSYSISPFVPLLLTLATLLSFISLISTLRVVNLDNVPVSGSDRVEGRATSA